MAGKIQIRRDTAANWTSVNPVLADGELGYIKDLKNFRIGNGTDNWAALPNLLNGSGIWAGTGSSFTSYAKGDLIYASATDVLSKLAVGTDGDVLTLASGIPVWSAPAGGGGLPSMTGNNGKWLTTDGTSASWAYNTGWSTSGNAGTTSANYIGTSDAQPLYIATNGLVRMTIDTNGNVLFASNANVLNPTATPFNMSFGNTYGNNTPGNPGNLKWDMYTKGGTRYGIGMSALMMEYQTSEALGHHTFFIAGTNVLDVSATGITSSISSGGHHTFYIGGTSALDVSATGIVTGTIDTGATLSNSKIYLYNQSSFKFGLGVQSGQFRLHVDSATSRFSFLSAPTGTEIFTIKGNGSIGINQSAPNASAILDIASTTKGLLPPRMTSTQWIAIASKSEGLQGWNNTDHAQMWYDGTRNIGFRYNGTKFQGYDGSSWIDLN